MEGQTKSIMVVLIVANSCKQNHVSNGETFQIFFPKSFSFQTHFLLKGRIPKLQSFAF